MQIKHDPQQVERLIQENQDLKRQLTGTTLGCALAHIATRAAPAAYLISASIPAAKHWHTAGTVASSQAPLAGKTR